MIRDPNEAFFSESLKEFVDLDIFLSPLTAYPVNNPIRLLFARPFERLYNDVYLIDESDYEKFIRRAYLLYSNFSEILAQGIRYLIWETDSCVDYEICDLGRLEDITDPEFWAECHYAADYFRNDLISLYDTGGTLENILKTLILHWNNASNRIDSLCTILEYLCDNSRYYHIIIEDIGFDIIDLGTNMSIFGHGKLVKPSGTHFLMNIISDFCGDPFTDFRPCRAFEELGLDVERKTYDELLEDLRSELGGLH